MVNRCCFIIPYFGKFPNYFNLFLKSCGYNLDYDWLVITNDHTEYSYPSNFRIEYMEYADVTALFQKKLGMDISMSKPYKLCDLKPTYGLVFQDYLKGYSFWGHCDVDTILGNLNNFISDELLNQYDKLFCLGHFSLYRNNNEINTMFMKEINNEFEYKNVFSTEKICWFDEEWNNKNSINRIFLNEGKKIFQEDYSANISVLRQKFRRVVFQGIHMSNLYKIEKAKRDVYIWNNGRLHRFYIQNKKLVCEEFMYIHLQQRKMRFKDKVRNSDIFKIVPNAFICIKKEPSTICEFRMIAKNTICFYWFKRIKIYFGYKLDGLKKRISRLIKR